MFSWSRITYDQFYKRKSKPESFKTVKGFASLENRPAQNTRSERKSELKRYGYRETRTCKYKQRLSGTNSKCNYNERSY